RSTGCGNGRGLCCWQRTVWRAERLDGRSGARPARPRSGVCAMPRSDLRASTRPVTGALSRSTQRQRANASWRCWISRRLRAMPAGRGRCWLRRSAMSMCSMSGASCAGQKIDLAGRKSWCESDDPEFVAKAADVVGLYLAPPENAVVICVDEKHAIQALERAQGYLKLPNGRTLTGHSHDYKRNGTTTLFAAFEVATGKVTAAHKKRRRRVEFLDFMNDIVAAHADTAIHVILDNLNTHKPRNDRWLKRHPNVRFHFTPTRASWLNQVEIWFSILQGKSLH